MAGRTRIERGKGWQWNGYQLIQMKRAGFVPAAPRELRSIELRSIPRGMPLKKLLLLSEVVGESGCADWRND